MHVTTCSFVQIYFQATFSHYFVFSGHIGSEVVGGLFGFRSDLSNPCRFMYNPVIFLPDDFFHAYDLNYENPTGTYQTLKKMDLPDAFEVMGGVDAIERQKWVAESSLRMNVSNWWSGQCADLGYGPSANQYLIGHRILSNGEQKQYHYEGYANLQENTIANPIADGGTSTISRGVRNSANVAKDFMNLDSCSLSTGQTCLPGDLTDKFERKSLWSNVLICGSNGEVGNNPAIDSKEANMFRFFESKLKPCVIRVIETDKSRRNKLTLF